MIWLEHQLLFGSLEVALVTLVVVMVTRVAGKKRARLCALLWLLVPLKALFVFIPASAWHFDLSIPDSPIFTNQTAQVSGTEQTTMIERAPEGNGLRPSVRDSSMATPSGKKVHAFSWVSLSALWLMGVGSVLAWHVFGLVRIGQVRRSAIPIPEALARLYQNEADRCGVRSPPALIVNTRMVGPLVVCGLRTSLFLPQWLIENSSQSRLRWVIRHELIHIRHFDHVGMVVQTVAEILFWFHPAVWWASREWRRDMEQACDDAVAGDPPEARRYAETLYFVLQNMVQPGRELTPVAGLYATRTEIGRRIERLLSREKWTPRKTGLLGIIGWVLAALAAGLFGLRSVDAEPVGTPSDRSALRIDLGPEDQRVESGWVGWSEDHDRDFVTGFDLDFEIEIDRGSAWRDNGPIDGATRFESLMRDGIRERDDDEIRITVKDLDPGDYVLELFSFDSGPDQTRDVGRFDLVIDDKIMLENQTTDRGESNTMASLPPVPLTSDGSDVVVELRRRDGDIWLNGFMISGRTRWAEDVKLGKIDLAEAPEAVQLAVEREIVGAVLDDIRRKVRDDALVYSVDADTPYGDLELEIASDGSLLERSEEIPSTGLPASVEQALAAIGEKVEIRKVLQEIKDGQETFVIDVRIGGDRERLILDRDGTVLSRRDDD
jgi:beta-lactamase regulating signal transducer with metallopeptidase domain